MSKAIIEIEKPKRCKDCGWYQADPWFGGSCKQAKEDGWNKHIDADDEYNVQNWCPLLPKTDAIPIEWIVKRINYYSDLILTYPNEKELLYSQTELISLLEDWEKENEIDRCR